MGPDRHPQPTETQLQSPSLAPGNGSCQYLHESQALGSYSPWRAAGEDKLPCAGGSGQWEGLLSLRLEPQPLWGSEGAAGPPFQPCP